MQHIRIKGEVLCRYTEIGSSSKDCRRSVIRRGTTSLSITEARYTSGDRPHTDLGRPRAVTLYYEPDLNKIAIQCADTRVPGRVPLIPKTNGAYYVPASQFIRQNRIHIAGTEAFIKPELNHNGILILDLNETVRVGRGLKLAPDWKPDPRASIER